MLKDRVYYIDVGDEDGGRTERVVVVICSVWTGKGTWTVAGWRRLRYCSVSKQTGHSHLGSEC